MLEERKKPLWGCWAEIEAHFGQSLLLLAYGHVGKQEREAIPLFKGTHVTGARENSAGHRRRLEYYSHSGDDAKAKEKEKKNSLAFYFYFLGFSFRFSFQ